MRAALILILIVVAASAAPTLADGQVFKALTPAEKLDRARQQFRAKDYQSATSTLEDLLFPTVELSRRDEVVEVHMMLGTCHYQLNKQQDAEREFEQALELDIERGMSELYPDGANKLFETTKARLRGRIEAEAKRKELAEREKRIREYIESIGVYETRSITQNFFPLGFPQSQNGHRTKAWIVGGAQATTFAVSLGSFLYLAAKYGLQAKVPIEDGPRVRRIQQLEIGAGIMFFAIYGYSVVDGLVYFKPRTRIESGSDSIRDLFEDKTKPPAKAKPKKTSFRNSLRFGPLLSPTGVGIGVAWETD